MKMPNNYNEIKVGGEFTPPAVGGHIAIIKGVQERKNKNGGDMIVVAFDFGKGDAQEGYFAKDFENDVRPDKKWPYAGTSYINVADRNGDCSRNFKAFCTAVEDSNKNFAIDWKGKDFGKQFKNKTVGVVFGMVENEYNGKVRNRSELRWFRKVSGVLDAKVPEPKLLKGAAPAPAQNDSDEELPF